MNMQKNGHTEGIPNIIILNGVGGDCTNFASQCIYAGGMPMNYKELYGWYYINGNNKSPSWTGVEFFYNFLTTNNGIGPKGKETHLGDLEIGDIIQLSFDEQTFTHTLIVVQPGNNIYDIKIACHTFDAFNKKLAEYAFERYRCIHIF